MTGSLMGLSRRLRGIMNAKLRAREYGLAFGTLPTGPKNALTDVAGVRVGHVTIREGDACTGVTAVLPHAGNLFRSKVEAAVHVINGFGKAAGLLQVHELGQIESPIMLTNTLSVPAVLDGAISHALAQCPEIGRETGTVNCVVGECNDSFLNDIRGRHVTAEHALLAIESSREGMFAEGAVGAGTGMVCYGYKGGIGTASRMISVEGLPQNYTLGVLVLSNFGRQENLQLCGTPIGRLLMERDKAEPAVGDGSVVIVVATDAPLGSRQLGRVARRGAFGLARTGSVASHGSGDFVIAFSTAIRHEHMPPSLSFSGERLAEDGVLLTAFFQAVTESVEEAVINSLFAAEDTRGRDGNFVRSLPAKAAARLVTRVVS